MGLRITENEDGETCTVTYQGPIAATVVASDLRPSDARGLCKLIEDKGIVELDGRSYAVAEDASSADDVHWEALAVSDDKVYNVLWLSREEGDPGRDDAAIEAENWSRICDWAKPAAARRAEGVWGKKILVNGQWRHLSEIVVNWADDRGPR